MDIQRLNLINRVNYWGVLENKNADEILKSFFDRPPLLDNAGWFVWEKKYPLKSENSLKQQHPWKHHQYGLAVCVTVIQKIQCCSSTVNPYVVKSERFSCKLFTPFDLEHKQCRCGRSEVDSYTLYIVHSVIDNCYYQVFNVDNLFRISHGIVSAAYKRIYGFRTLKDAITCTVWMNYSARLSYLTNNFENEYAVSGIPIPYARFTSLLDKPCSLGIQRIHSLWSLQDLCSFLLQNYLKGYSNRADLLQPVRIRDKIASFSTLRNVLQVIKQQ
jgi:hypothetical protein